MSEYLIEASVLVNRPRDDLMRWLTTPDLMARWIVGADSAQAVDVTGLARDGTGAVGAALGVLVRLTVSMPGGQFRIANSYLGEIAEIGESRLVRRYQLEHSKVGVVGLRNGPADYERTVTYELGSATSAGPVTVSCTALTIISGLSRAAAKAGAKSETRSLRRSLDQLRDCAEDRGGGLLGRLRGSGLSVQAL